MKSQFTIVINFNVFFQPRFYFLAVFLLIANYTNSYSSFKDSVRYDIGKPMPSFTLTEIYEKPGDIINNSTMKGKFVILDFWDVTCVACINSFQKLDQLQSRFKDKLDIILVGNKGSTRNKNISSVYESYKKKWNLRLTSAFDEHIFKRFSITYVPHLIWIDSNGVVKAITTSEELKESNIESFIGNNLQLGDVRKKNARSSLSSRERSNIVSKINYSFKVDDTLSTNTFGETLSISAISEWQEGMYYYNFGGFANHDGNKDNGRYRFQQAGYTATKLYLQTTIGSYTFDILDQYNFTLLRKDGPPNYLKPIFKYKDTLRFNQLLNNNQKKFNYLIIRPRHLVSDEIMQAYMLKDLEAYFGYTAVVEIREMPCLVLTANEGAKLKLESKAIKYKRITDPAKISYRKGNFSEVLKALIFQLQDKKMVLFNETALSLDLNVDVDLSITYKDSIDNINIELGKYGLSIHETTRPHRVVVIKEL